MRGCVNLLIFLTGSDAGAGDKGCGEDTGEEELCAERGTEETERRGETTTARTLFEGAAPNVVGKTVRSS